MSAFTIHGILGSPYMRATLMGFEEKGLPYGVAPIAPGDQRLASHLERHPFGRIPAVDHGDFRLYETQAILRYLDRLYPEPALVPADPQREARANQIAGIVDWYVMPNISSAIVFQRLVAPRFGMPVDEARLAEAIPRAEVCMAELSRLLGDQTFLTGDAVSIADLMAAAHLDFFAQTEESRPMFAAHTNLARWLERMTMRPSMIATSWEALAQRHAA